MWLALPRRAVVGYEDYGGDDGDDDDEDDDDADDDAGDGGDDDDDDDDVGVMPSMISRGWTTRVSWMPRSPPNRPMKAPILGFPCGFWGSSPKDGFRRAQHALKRAEKGAKGTPRRPSDPICSEPPLEPSAGTLLSSFHNSPFQLSSESLLIFPPANSALQEASRGPQECPETAQDGFKSRKRPPRCAKTVPRGSPGAPQEAKIFGSL